MSGKKTTQGYIDFFEPDVYVEARSGLAKAAGIDLPPLRPGRSRIVSLDEFVCSDRGHRSDFAFGENIFDLYRDLYERIFQFSPKRERQMAKVVGSPRDAALIEATFGIFPKVQNLSYIEQGFKDAFDPEEIPLDVANWCKIVERGSWTPLYMTEHGIDHYYNSHRDAIIFIFDPSSTPDLIDLWNLRQFQEDVIPVSVYWALDLRDFLRSFITRTHRSLPGNQHGIMINTTVEFSRSISEERGEALAEQLFNDLPTGSWSRKHWYDPIWITDHNDSIAKPHRVRLTAKETNLELKVNKDDRSIRFDSISPAFSARFGGSRVRWANTVSLSSYRPLDDFALTLPRDYPNFGQIRLGGELLSSREGLVLFVEHKDQSQYWRVPRGSDAISEWLKSRGFDVKKADTGRIADQIMASLRGGRGTFIFEDKDTLILLDKMAKSVRTEIDGTVHEYPDRTAGAKEWKRLIKLREQRSFGVVRLEDFVSAGALKLGMSLDCSNCNGHNWYGLESLSETLKCSRCLQDFSFPQGSVDFKNTPWSYRVVGPFSVPDFAAGSYATLLSLQVFADKLGGAGHTPISFSTNLELSRAGERPVEIDFALWLGQTRSFCEGRNPQFLVGEAKSFAKEAFRDEDVRRMKWIATCVPGTFLVFSVMKESLSTNEQKLLREIALWGREALPDGRQRAPVIVLTGRELFASFYLSNAWEVAGGDAAALALSHVRFDNPWELAELTQRLYLGLDSLATWKHERRKKQRLTNT